MDGHKLARKIQDGEGSGELGSFGEWLEAAVMAAPASSSAPSGGALSTPASVSLDSHIFYSNNIDSWAW